MSRLEELIAELCPNGVEYKRLADICNRQKGIAITAGEMKELDTPSGDIRIFAAGNTIANVNYEDIPAASVITIPSVIVKSRGNIGFEYYDKPFTHKNEMWSYSSKDKNINIKFVYYFLDNHINEFQVKAKTGKLPQISTPDTDNYKIPVPPLPVQEEIVRILDKFTELTAELATELAKRKQQYQYYRNTLVDFKEGFDRPSPINGLIAELCPNGVGYKNLGEVVSFLNGRAYKQQELLSEGKYKILRVGNFYTNDKWYYSDLELEDDKYCENGDLLFSWAASLGAHIWNEGKTIFHYHIWKLKFDENIISKKYLYYFLNKDIADIQSSVTKSTMVHVSMGSMGKRKIPVPPLPIQEEIVRILDQFEALCNALASEIEARKKQYEYYRDKLLTFKEAV